MPRPKDIDTKPKENPDESKKPEIQFITTEQMLNIKLDMILAKLDDLIKIAEG